MVIVKAITLVALGPRNNAGGQINLSEMPDDLTSPASSLPSLFGWLPWWQRDRKSLMSHSGYSDHRKVVAEANSAPFEQLLSGLGIVLYLQI